MKINAAQLLIGSHQALRPAIVCGDQSLTYGELQDAVARSATAWRRLGLQAGDRVAIRLPDGIPWVLSFLGVLWAGGVAAGVNPRIPADQWDYVLSEAQFRFVIADSVAGTPSAWHNIVVPVDQWLTQIDQVGPTAPEPMDPEMPAFWTHSSGTTGKPKAVVHAHRAALHLHRTSQERLGVRADDRLFASSRLFFCYPLANSLLAGLRLGATVVLDPHWPTVETVVNTLRAQRPSVFFSVPSFFRDLLRANLAQTVAELGVRLCVSAGEAMPIGVRQTWLQQSGLTIANGFGASETLTLALLDTDGSQHLTPAPGVRISAARHALADEPIRIGIQTPTLALGYWRRPVEQAASFHDNAYHPADLFIAASADSWHFAGREDSLVKIHGRWVDLVELDERVMAHPDIVDAATVAVPDGDGVETLALYYVPRSDAPTDMPGQLGQLIQRWPSHQQRRPCIRSTRSHVRRPANWCVARWRPCIAMGRTWPIRPICTRSPGRCDER
ncbi:MAG: AMP-binding protein [Burkholderiaceae bacterium]